MSDESTIFGTEGRSVSTLNTVIENLGKYFNVRSKSAFINILIDMEEAPGVVDSGSHTTADAIQRLADAPPEHQLGTMFLEWTEGSLSTDKMIEKIKIQLDGEHKDKVVKLVSVTYEPEALKDIKDVARPILKKADDDTYGPSYFFPVDWIVGGAGTSTPSPKYTNHEGVTPSLQDLFWSQGMIDEMVLGTRNTKEEVLATYDIDITPGDGRDNPQNADREKNVTINAAAKAGEPPSKENPIVICFDILNDALSPATRDSSAVSVFTNFVPSLEMSRCQPYLDIQIISMRPPLADEKKIDTLSLSQFLMGNIDVTKTADGGPGASDAIISKAINANLFSSGLYRNDEDTPEDESKIATAGMEIFTAPQLMVNADDMSFAAIDSLDGAAPDDSAGGVDSARAANVLDKFRPLASLTSFSVDVTPSGGMMSHKTAKISLVLHDRSRLAELGEFIKPDLYGKTELLIEYGWMHPDGLNLASDGMDNPFADLLNSLRVKEKYKVVNSDFSFDEVGQVEIGLSLSMVGLMSFDTNDISKGPGVKDALKEVQDLFDTVRRLRRRMQPEGQSRSQDVSGETWLNSVSSMSGIAGMDDETRNAMNTWRTSQAANPDTGAAATELRAALTELMGPAGDNGGAMAQLDQTIDAALAWKKEHLRSSKSGDPWWNPVTNDEWSETSPRRASGKYCKVRISSCDPRVDPSLEDGQRSAAAGGAGRNIPRGYSKFVSLGKLLMTYVSAPLALDGKFDEIQWFFYPFNEHASFMNSRQISEFPINIDKFQEELEKLTKQTAYIPLRRFLGMLQSKFVGNIDNEAWGLADLYKDDPDNEGQRMLRQEYTGDSSPTALHDAKNKRLACAYGKAGDDAARGLRFKKPRIGIHTECVPDMNKGADGQPAKARTILKIHVYDKQCSSYSTCQDLLSAARNDSLGLISAQARDTADQPAPVAVDGVTPADERRAKLIEQANAAGILEKVTTTDGQESYRIKGGFPAVKRFIKSVMPSIIFGSATSAITSVSMSSMNDPQMATIFMMRSGQGTARTPSGTRSAGLPLKVSPVSLDLEMIGCPVVGFGQQFFVDMGTGTNVDNVYAVTGISHSLAPGEFKTSLKMTQLDAYGAYESAMNAVNTALAELPE